MCKKIKDYMNRYDVNYLHFIGLIIWTGILFINILTCIAVLKYGTPPDLSVLSQPDKLIYSNGVALDALLVVIEYFINIFAITYHLANVVRKKKEKVN